MLIKKLLLFVAVLLVISFPLLAQDETPALITPQTAPYLTLETTLQTDVIPDISTLYTFAATPDGHDLFWYDSAQILHLDTATGEKTVLKDLPNNSAALAISPDGRQLAALISYEVHIAEIEGLTSKTFDTLVLPYPIWMLASSDYPQSLSYAPDGSLLVVNTSGAMQRMAPELIDMWRVFAPNGTQWSVTYDYAPNRVMLTNNSLFIISPEGDVTVCQQAQQADFNQPTLAEALCGQRLYEGGDKALQLLGTIPNAKAIYQHPTEPLVAVSLSDQEKVILLDAQTGATRREIDYSRIMPDAAYFSQMAFTPDGSLLVIAGMGQASVWDVATGDVAYQMKPLIPPDSPIGMGLTFGDWFAISADSRLLALTEYDPFELTGGVVLYDLQSHERLAQLPTLPNFMTFSADGTRLLTLGNEAQVWQVAADAVIPTAVTPGDQVAFTPLKSIAGADLIADFKIGDYGCTFTCVFSHDGTLAVLDAGKFDVQVWDVASGAALWRLGDVQSAAFSPDDQTLYALSANGLQVYNARSGAVKATLLPDKVYADRFAAHPDGRVAFLGSNYETGSYGIDLWDATSGVLDATINAIDDITWISQANFSPDGNFLVVTGEAGEQKLTVVIDTQTWQRTGTLDIGWLEPHFTTDDALLVPEGDELMHYDLATLKPIQKQPLPPDVREVGGGTRLLGVLNTETEAQVYDLDSGTLLATLPAEYPVEEAFVDNSDHYVLVLSSITEEQMRLEVWRMQ
ncbi:MAG TPA: hypothetical protein VHO69_06980 [Phototrophicaceae bacterium]|nr:hypothetical protein [Phototrophicaceae bacterium]